MILFFDTSALVKIFHEEKGSETVDFLCEIVKEIGFETINPLSSLI